MNSKLTFGFKALLINQKDNVGVALDSIPQGKSALLVTENGTVSKIVVTEDIPLGHKIATKDIPKGKHVIKYGERIGLATSSIKSGAHVHIHNLHSMRGKDSHTNDESL
jgi:altronate dehydratase small subunit